jgi:hypothetical protein
MGDPADPELLQLRKKQAANSGGQMAERIASLVTVAVCVGKSSNPHTIQNDDERPFEA